jgi:hypothetical protein
MDKKRYWLTPPELYAALDAEFHFDFDPCPYPRPDGFDGLSVPWGSSNFINPPFLRADCDKGKGYTAFARRAVEEQQRGNTAVLLLPVTAVTNLLLSHGAEIRPLGRVRWLDITANDPMPSPGSVGCFILRPLELERKGDTDEKA